MSAVEYRPMHPPRKEVTQEQMLETLKRRVRESVEKHAGSVTPVLVTQTPAPVGITWKKPVRNPDGTGYIESVCGIYVVGKAFVNGKPRYTASKRVPNLWVYAMQSYDTAAEAQARCNQEATQVRT